MAIEAIHVCGIAGSLRQGSYNRMLIDAAAEIAPDGMTIEPFDLDDIPLYDQDVEKQGDPKPVQRLKETIASADALLIATPEYQHGIPGVLKNALDWASRPPGKSVLTRKAAAIMGGTQGRMGTARAQSQLRQTLVYSDTRVVQQPEVLVANVQSVFDGEGRLTDEATRKFIRQLLDALAERVQLLRSPA